MNGASRSHWHSVLFYGAGLALLGVWGWRLKAFTGAAASVLVSGAALYLLAHLLRASRLAFILSDPKVSVRTLFRIHFFTAGVSLLFPLKLGEIFRVTEIGHVVDSPVRGWVTVWLERTMDMFVIALATVLALAVMPSLFPSFLLPIAVVFSFVAITVLMFGVFPENAESLKLFIIRRYRAEWTIPVLRIISGGQHVLAQGQKLMSTRLITLLSLTLLIWTLEIGVLSFFIPVGMSGAETAWIAVAYLFSRLLLNPAPYLAKVVAGLGLVAQQASLMGALSTYQGLIELALISVASLTFLGMVFSRRPTALKSQKWVPAWP